MLEIRDKNDVSVYRWTLGERFPDLTKVGAVSLHADGVEAQFVMLMLKAVTTLRIET